jgi:hypothetical protein
MSSVEMIHRPLKAHWLVVRSASDHWAHQCLDACASEYYDDVLQFHTLYYA